MKVLDYGVLKFLWAICPLVVCLNYTEEMSHFVFQLKLFQLAVLFSKNSA